MPQRKRARCFQEVKLFEGLQNDHVLHMFDAFIDQNQLIIVLEWASGGDLKRLIRKAREAGTPLTEAVVWKHFLQVVLGVKYLHLQRIMHRDIKPANVMVAADGMASCVFCLFVCTAVLLLLSCELSRFAVVNCCKLAVPHAVTSQPTTILRRFRASMYR
jgi:serine/threonine protein kinase